MKARAHKGEDRCNLRKFLRKRKFGSIGETAAQPPSRNEKQIFPIVDKRRTAKEFQPVDDDYREVITHVMDHDIILLSLRCNGTASPTQ
jgi:hypothetical protein